MHTLGRYPYITAKLKVIRRRCDATEKASMALADHSDPRIVRKGDHLVEPVKKSH